MEENSENPRMAGSGAGGGSGQTNGISSNGAGAGSNGSAGVGQPVRTTGRVVNSGQAYAHSLQQQQQQQPSAGSSSAATPLAAGGQAAAGGADPNGTLGAAKGSAFMTTKRTRIGGLPPPVYSPLGASSPSLSSNAPTFPAVTNPALGAAGSAASTPSATPTASPQTSHSVLSTPTQQHQLQVQQQSQQQNQHYSSPSAQTQQLPSAANQNSHRFPALHLIPLNDTFIPKQISLDPPCSTNRIKIGRQTNAKTVPGPSNGYFDSKVLSRMHAEVWCENGKVYIKDVKSSNGTFINGERLSPEGIESDVFELHNNDMVEFGIDITSEDTKTIVHHKVAARAYIVMNNEDAIATQRNFANYYRELGDSPMHRRAGLGAKGSMGAPGMNLDQVLNRLQTELQKSRDTGVELGALTGTIGEIHETLGGNLPGPPMPAYRVPPFVPPNPNAPPSPQHIAQQQQQATQALLNTLQTQLQETQSALNGHVDRINNLEGLLSEQERMKSELKELKDRMEEVRAEWEQVDRQKRKSDNRSAASDEGEDEEDIPDDASMRTIKLDNGLPERSISSYDELRKGHAMPKRDNGNHRDDDATSSVAQMQARLESENATLFDKIEALTSDLSAAAQLSNSLKSQYTEAAQTIRALEQKVNSLEVSLQTQAQQDGQPVPSGPSPLAQAKSQLGSVATREMATSPLSPGTSEPAKEEIIKEVENRFANWKNTFEAAIKQERADWEEERDHLRIAVQEWERRSAQLQEQQAQQFQQQQAAGQSSSVQRKKRRSKASTVGTSSEESSGSQEDDEEGFASPITDDSGHSPATSMKGLAGIAAGEDSSVSRTKRPRSRRRRRTPDSESPRSAGRSSTGKSESGDGSQEAGRAVQNGASGATGYPGGEVRRRKSWIPFASPAKEQEDNLFAEGRGKLVREGGSRDARNHKSKDGAGVMEHPALPLVSAAGIVVLGYLAYTAVVQHQK